MKKSLQADRCFDWDHPDFTEWMRPVRESKAAVSNQVLDLYVRVRDEILYNPFEISLEDGAVSASGCIARGYGHCIDKSVVFCSGCRSLGVPAKIGLARVQNHIGTARLEKALRSQVLVPHGYAEVYLNSRWIKCTPAFNKSLCEKLGVEPLDFDGNRDSIFQPFDGDGRMFMEYIEDFGSFAVFPKDFVKKVMMEEYPHLFDNSGNFTLKL